MGETFTNNFINSSIYHLLNFEKYASFQAAAREAAIANDYQIVLFSEDFNAVFAVETRHNESIEEAVRQRLKHPNGSGEKSVPVSVNGLMTYWGSLTISDIKYYLMIVDNEGHYSQDDIVKLAEIIELAMGMWNYVPQRNLTAEFIRALRRGNRGLAHNIMEEMGHQESDFRGVFYVPGVSEEEGLKKLAKFESEYGIETMKVAEVNEIAGLLLDSPNEKEYGEPEWKAFAKKMFESGADKTFHVIGVDGIEGMCSAFQNINESEAFIQLIFPYKHSFTKYELALAANCVNICMQGGNVKKNFLDLIKPFREAKDAKGKQLMDTLETFVLDAGLSTAKTARLMGLHANTVQYRVKRIKEIMGVDFTINTIVPGLMMALAVSRIEKEVRSF